jgi:hypothetical protein
MNIKTDVSKPAKKAFGTDVCPIEVPVFWYVWGEESSERKLLLFIQRRPVFLRDSAQNI